MAASQLLRRSANAPCRVPGAGAVARGVARDLASGSAGGKRTAPREAHGRRALEARADAAARRGSRRRAWAQGRRSVARVNLGVRERRERERPAEHHLRRQSSWLPLLLPCLCAHLLLLALAARTWPVPSARLALSFLTAPAALCAGPHCARATRSLAPAAALRLLWPPPSPPAAAMRVPSLAALLLLAASSAVDAAPTPANAGAAGVQLTPDSWQAQVASGAW